MHKSHHNNSSDLDDLIDLREIFSVLLQGKWIIVSVTAFVSIIAVIYSLLLPNIYESKALLAPIKESSGISGALKNYSALAGVAGINLNSSIDGGRTAEAIKKIQSLSFFENNLMINIHLPDLMAFKSWDSKTNTLNYDEDIYDIINSSWVSDSFYQNQQMPSAQESFEVFLKQHLKLSEDIESGFITLSIKHQSPYLAKQWAQLVVDEINHFYRQKDKLESEKTINYLNQQISVTSFSEIKEVLALLVQEEIKKLALIEANPFYVFSFIDPPAVMEEKSQPNRAFICILSALLGGILSIFMVIIRHYSFTVKPNET